MTTKIDILAFADRTIAYHAMFARVAGRAANGVFLSQLYYWTGKGADPDGWIWKTQDEWEEETALTRSEQRTARAALADLGLLEEERRGVPARLYFRLNLERLAELCEADANRRVYPRGATVQNGPTRCAESAQQDGQNVPNKMDTIGPSISEMTSESIPERRAPRPAAHPALMAYVEEARRAPPKGWWETVADTVGTKPDAVERWRALVRDWVGHGWNKSNVSGMLDKYRTEDPRASPTIRAPSRAVVDVRTGGQV